jgi:hypothetical protein
MIPPLPEGQSVPEGFKLPWNTTRTMADVWKLSEHERTVERLRLPPAKLGRPAGSRTSPSPKIAYAGREA